MIRRIAHAAATGLGVLLTLLAGSGLAVADALAESLRGETIDYRGTKAYVVRPAGEPRAGLIVIHEWWGLNDNIREISHRLAAEGYLAYAVDLYDGEVTTDPTEARALAAAAMDDRSRIDERLLAAFQWLREEGSVAQVGSIGWCFGGSLALRAAILLPEELRAAVIYYGRLETDATRLAPLMMPILGIFGGQDRGIPVESVLEFESTLQALGKTVEIVIYDDAEHAFANPAGARHDPEAAADAWQRTLRFLAEHL